VKKAEVNSGKRAGVPAEIADKVKALEHEVRELRQANEILRKPVLSLSKGRPHISRRRSWTARSGNDRVHSRSPRCPWGRADLPRPADRPIHLRRARRAATRSDTLVGSGTRRCGVQARDRVFAKNFVVYGVRKVWREMMREGFPIALFTLARLMRDMGLAGVIRGKPVRTTISDKAALCSLDHVNRQFYAPAPNMPWVSDFTYVATWAGLVYVAFVIDTYVRRIVGWRASRTAYASFVLDALEQALHDRRPGHRGGLFHHSDRESQYLSIKYIERPAEAGIEPSVGSVGDSYDNALAETINGLYKTAVIHRRGPWRSFEAVEYATLEWVDWFDHRRLLEPIGNPPPVEAEDQYYAVADNIDMGGGSQPRPPADPVRFIRSHLQSTDR
jgi:putative transposase